MPETVSETPPQTPPPPVTTPDPFQTPKVEPKPLEAPPASNFMADLTKAFQKEVDNGTQPAPDGTLLAPPPPLAAPAPAPAPAPEPEQKPVEPPQTFTPKAKDRWRAREEEYRTELTTFQTKAKELQAQLETARKRLPELEEELAKAKETLTERNQALERFDVERSPIFKEKVLDPEESVKGRLAKQDLGTGEINALLSSNIAHREQVLENPRISAYRKGQIIQLLDKWDEIQETKQHMVTNGKKSLEEFARAQAEAEQAKKAQFLREAQQVYENQVIELQNKLEPFVEVAGDDENSRQWNEAVPQRKQLARAIYLGALDRQQLAQAAMWAAAAPAYRALLGKALARIQELSTVVDKQRGVQPGVRDSGADTQIIQTSRPASDGDFVKNLVDRFNKETL